MDMLDVGRSDAVGFGYVSQILLCLYGARFSYVAITNLRKYEETTKKAAKWSQLVQDHLTKTRTTQATGALCFLLCFSVSSAVLAGSRLNKTPVWTSKVVGPTMLLAVMAMRRYVQKYWAPYKDSNGKDVAGARVPLPKMEDYNEAEEMTERVLEVMSYLEYSWVATSFFALIGWKL